MNKSIQKNLDGKNAVKKSKCSVCDEWFPVSQLYSGAIYQPFDSYDDPTCEYENVCEVCETEIMYDTSYCEICNRRIYNNNGYRKNIRVNTKIGNGDEIYVACVSCLHELWLEYGMWQFDDGDFFSVHEFTQSEYDWKKINSYWCRFSSGDCHERAKQEFDELREKDKKVIVCIEKLGHGGGAMFSLWIQGDD